MVLPYKTVVLFNQKEVYPGQLENNLKVLLKLGTVVLEEGRYKKLYSLQ